MTKSLAIVLLVLTMGWVTTCMAEAISKDKLAAIKELIKVTGARVDQDQFAQSFTQQMLSVLRARYPKLPATAASLVEEEVRAVLQEQVDQESLQREIYPIYAKYFSDEEIQALIRFNQSPVGRKANKVMPALLQESMSAAQVWSQTIGPIISTRVMTRLRKEGLDE
jgi:uncharacterized protein